MQLQKLLIIFLISFSLMDGAKSDAAAHAAAARKSRAASEGAATAQAVQAAIASNRTCTIKLDADEKARAFIKSNKGWGMIFKAQYRTQGSLTIESLGYSPYVQNRSDYDDFCAGKKEALVLSTTKSNGFSGLLIVPVGEIYGLGDIEAGKEYTLSLRYDENKKGLRWLNNTGLKLAVGEKEPSRCRCIIQ